VKVAYNALMKTGAQKPFNAMGAEAQHLQTIEGNPLTVAEIEMFEMFEREGWSHERRRAHIVAQFKRPISPKAAE
jgi:hypothetical protein